MIVLCRFCLEFVFLYLPKLWSHFDEYLPPFCMDINYVLLIINFMFCCFYLYEMHGSLFIHTLPDTPIFSLFSVSFISSCETRVYCNSGVEIFT